MQKEKYLTILRLQLFLLINMELKYATLYIDKQLIVKKSSISDTISKKYIA